MPVLLAVVGVAVWPVLAADEHAPWWLVIRVRQSDVVIVRASGQTMRQLVGGQLHLLLVVVMRRPQLARVIVQYVVIVWRQVGLLWQVELANGLDDLFGDFGRVREQQIISQATCRRLLVGVQARVQLSGQIAGLS